MTVTLNLSCTCVPLHGTQKGVDGGAGVGAGVGGGVGGGVCGGAGVVVGVGVVVVVHLGVFPFLASPGGWELENIATEV